MLELREVRAASREFLDAVERARASFWRWWD